VRTATRANAGSLLNGVSTAQNNGIIPFLLWALGNTLACIVFGIVAPKIPKLRDVFRSRPMKIIMGIMCPFQCWISMNGIQTVFSDTILGHSAGVVIALAFAVFFIVLLFKFGMIRNVLTDHMSWTAVYILVFATAAIALYTGEKIPLTVGAESVGIGLKNCVLLIPGAFLYPYYYELLDYNDKNDDGTNTVNIRKAFIVGGVIFGAYLFFIFAIGGGFICYFVFRWLDNRYPHTRRIPIASLALCFIYVYVAEHFFGIADITGAYVAGIILCNIRDSEYIAEKMDINSYMLFGPIFFASIGLKTDISEINTSILVFSVAFVIVGLACKVIGCGLVAKLCKFSWADSLKIGVGMMTRGEVALIVSQKGLSVGLISPVYFTAVILLIITSSILTPIILQVLYKKMPPKEDTVVA